ncbi:MAG: aminotransferase class I/II-fold pyridoxal phosphate-dependent enzyme [Planctomycetes bacterium]|nr:aminotransferase class I/II-fold pyridoxal phosphate-dependent enzyme [Planctomycetota bacterium]
MKRTTRDITKICVRPDDELLAAFSAIGRDVLGMALVLADDGTLIGVVTDGDIRRKVIERKTLDLKVRDVMNASPTTMKATSKDDELIRKRSHKIKHIPLLDEAGKPVDIFTERFIPVAEPSLGDEEMMNVFECVASGWISSGGQFVRDFEELFAKYCGSKFAISTSNGTTALHLALAALGLTSGDEAIVPALTFIATANAVTYTGARAVLADVSRETWNIDPAEIERKITRRTKAIIPVHLYGLPADMDRVMEIARRNSLFVVEDAAEAHGASVSGRKVGSIGDAACFSFYGNKIITTGEGGMVTTDNEELARKMRILRDHGMNPERRYFHDVVGFNYRMTNIQAALGVAQLRKIDSLIAKKQRILKRYESNLSGVAGISFMPRGKSKESVCWLVTILVDAPYRLSRDQLAEKLREGEVDSRPVFLPVSEMPPYASDEKFPNADFVSARGLTLPTSPNLSDAEVERICAIIRTST